MSLIALFEDSGHLVTQSLSDFGVPPPLNTLSDLCHQRTKTWPSSENGFKNLQVCPGIHSLGVCDLMGFQGREIPEDVAARTDRENEFPMNMWKKLGDAGYEVSPCVSRVFLLSHGSFLGITAAEDYGGLAMGYQAHCTVMAEISRASGTFTS